MRRFALSLIAIAVAATLYSGTTAAGTPCQGTCFFWTLSFSPTDPFVHTAPPGPGATSVYLWYVCPGPETEVPGLQAAEFAVHASGGLSIAGFLPTNGFLNAGTPTELALVVGGCPQGPIVAGTFTMLDPSGMGGSACLANDAHGFNVSVDCWSGGAPPTPWDNRYRGVSSDGSVPCSGTPESCGTVAVKPTPWGSMKALYR